MDWLGILAILGLTITGGLIIAKAVAYLLLIWFDDAKFFVEYAKIFKLDKIFPHIRQFLEAQSKGSPNSYLDFISLTKDGFITRLLTCPKCLSFWLSFFPAFYTLVIFSILNSKLLIGFLFLPIIALAISWQSLKFYKEYNK